MKLYQFYGIIAQIWLVGFVVVMLTRVGDDGFPYAMLFAFFIFRLMGFLSEI